MKALSCDCGEVAGELGVLGQNHCSSSYEAVDEGFLTHQVCFWFEFSLDLAPSYGGKKERENSVTDIRRCSPTQFLPFTF